MIKITNTNNKIMKKPQVKMPKEIIQHEELTNRILGVITTNHNKGKIDVKTTFDYKFKLFRVEVKLKKK